MPGFTPFSMFPRMWAATGGGLPRARGPADRAALAARTGGGPGPPVSRGRLAPAGESSCCRAAALLPLRGVRPAGDGAPRRAVGSSPASAEELGALIVTEVPSGLPRLPDEDLTPPAGQEAGRGHRGLCPRSGTGAGGPRGLRLPVRLGTVLGHRDGPVTGVFVDQFDTRAGAAPTPRTSPATTPSTTAACWRRPRRPAGRLLVADRGGPRPGAAARAGRVRLVRARVFSVSVTAVADSVDAAEEEVRAVLEAQLDCCRRADASAPGSAPGRGRASAIGVVRR